MAKWVDVEFRSRTKCRRLQDVVSLTADLLMLWDFLASLVCGQIAGTVWRHSSSSLGTSHETTATFLPEVVMGSLTLALALRSTKTIATYESVSVAASLTRWERRLSAACAAFIALGLAAQIGHRPGQIWILAWLLIVIPILAATRWALTNWLLRLKQSGALRESVAIVGAPRARERLAVRIAAETAIVGFYQAPSDQMQLLNPFEIEKLQEMGVEGCVDSVVLAIETEQTADISHIIERLKMLPVQLGICKDGEWPRPDRSEFRYLAGVPIQVVMKRPINRRDMLIKSVLDKLIAIILLLLLLPLMVIIAGLVATTSRGPVIFRQIRHGWCGQQFTVFKFRTMQDVPNAGCACKQTKRNDPRCTRVGRVLRKTSLDELPQLWNVIRGSMSLVGPRPHAEMLDENDRTGQEIVAEYAQRYRVRPGMTGWAQIHGARGATTTVEQLRRRVAFDLYYIEHWSLWLDIVILARTPFCMTGKNVF